MAILFLLSSLGVPGNGSAQSILPQSGTMVFLRPAFAPPLIKGVKLSPDNPLKFDFIIDTGEDPPENEKLRLEVDKMVKYFLATLTVPNDELWVNLSPYEEDRIVSERFGQTQMGRDLLAQDYLLKQLTASLIYPEDEIGRQFWGRVQKLSYERFGTTDIPLNTFNKVWVVPQKAVVYENGDTAFVVEARLKIMLEEDYLAQQNLAKDQRRQTMDETSSVTNEILREVIIPELEREVNEGENFVQLRQIYYSMILATWFKRNLNENILKQVYIDQNKIVGVNVAEKGSTEKIYAEYLEAFKKGVYDYIKEDYDPASQELVPRKYFSGGARMGEVDQAMEIVHASTLLHQVAHAMDNIVVASVGLNPEGLDGSPKSADQAMLNEGPTPGIFKAAIEPKDIEGSTVVGAQGIPEWLRFVLAFYESQNDTQTLTRIKQLIRSGKLRAGPENSKRKGGIQDGNTFVIFSSAEDLNPDLTLVELITKTSPELARTEEIVQKYSDWQKEIKRKTFPQLIQHTQGVVATLMKSFDEAGIFELFKDGQGGFKTLRVKDIIDYIKEKKGIDVYRNRQYLHGALSELAALGWMTRRGPSASDSMRITLTEKGQKAINLNFPSFYARVSRHMPQALDMSAYLLDTASGEPNELQAVAELSKRGWDIPEDVDADLTQELREHLNGFLMGALMFNLHQMGIFERFDVDLMFDTGTFEGNKERLSAAFEIFEQTGFVIRQEEMIKMTPSGVAMFSRALSHGVPFSYSPSYALVETFLFGDLKSIQRRDSLGRELLVYRGPNAKSSGDSHKTYFRQTDKILIGRVNEKVRNGEIPSVSQLQQRLEAGMGPFEFTVADTGAGDGTWLERIYNVIVNETEYGMLMRQYPELYKLRMIGIDYNPEPLEIIKARLDKAGIPNLVVQGDINRPQDIGRKLAEHGIVGKVNIHVSSMLIHNRPYTGVKDKLAAKRRQKEGALSKGAFGWRGRVIPNGELEQNLYEFFKAWGEIADEMIIIELHTIDEEIAAHNLKRTLDIAYRWSHLLSDQFIVEDNVFTAIAEEAGFESLDVTRNPPAPGLVTVTTRRLAKKKSLPVHSDASVREDILLPSASTSAGSQARRDADSDKAMLGTSNLILVVDDKAAVRDRVVDIIESRGFDTVEASNGHHALRVLEEFGGRVRGIVTDHHMPVMEGEALLAELLEQYPDIPVIMLTGASSMIVRKEQLAGEFPNLKWFLEKLNGGFDELADVSEEVFGEAEDIEGSAQYRTAAAGSIDRAMTAKRILYVEDEDDLRELIAYVLEKEGHEVMTAENAAEALKRVKEYSGNFDVVITDVRMPGMWGTELLEELRIQFPELPAIITSGTRYDIIETPSNLKAVLEKPFGKEQLISALEKIFPEDKAALTDKNVGGIDMNPDLLDLETRGAGVDVKFDPAFFQNAPITGFSPIIYSITPVMNLPLLLGLTSDPPPDAALPKADEVSRLP